MKSHICEYRPVCICGITSDSPDEDCLVHMKYERQHRCSTCGRFLKVNDSNKLIKQKIMYVIESRRGPDANCGTNEIVYTVCPYCNKENSLTASIFSKTSCSIHVCEHFETYDRVGRKFKTKFVRNKE